MRIPNERYLEEASCASVCVATCKLPTQQFFNEDMSVPMRMLPNYETYEVMKTYKKLYISKGKRQTRENFILKCRKNSGYYYHG